ncbi:PASTA domain-containing protein [Sphingomonas trueperi]|uniref:PASTA domain-containing protein n=1 Tax=Sphingomonas trueperi TaxID=53317 RepID=UPI000EAC75C3
MSSFEIPDGPAQVTLKPGASPADPARGSAVYAVTNKALAPVTARLAVQVTGDAKSDWFAVEGERERPFAPGETQTVTVSIAVPPGAPPGEHKFRLRVVAVNDPDNDHVESPIGTIAVAAAPLAGGNAFPWWAVAIGIGTLVLLVFLFTAFVSPGFLRGTPAVAPTPTPTSTPTSTPSLPPIDEARFRDKPYSYAEGYLGAIGYKTRARANATATGLAPQAFLSATVSTAAGDPPGTVDILYDPGVAVPHFLGLTPAQAKDRAGDRFNLSLCKSNTPTDEISGKVVRQSVDDGSVVAKGSPVQLTVATVENIPLCLRRPFPIQTFSPILDYRKFGIDAARRRPPIDR